MQRLILLALVGFMAQLVDGALGMAYGVTSTTLLLSIGIASTAASASVHMAEIGTTLASGAAHWKLGNVNWRTVGILALPGGIGAFLGATALSSLPGGVAKPWTSTILFVLGAYVLLRFLFWHDRKISDTGKPLPKRFLMPLGFFGGLIDAMGGGGWGPVATPSLLASGRMLPRQVIGTVDTSEFVIAVSATLGFFINHLLHPNSEGLGTMRWDIVGAILIGGLFAAPLAAWLVRFLHPRVLGSAVGGLIIITNARTLMQSLKFNETAAIATYTVLVLIWASALVYTFIELKKKGDTILAMNGEQEAGKELHSHEDNHAPKPKISLTAQDAA